MCEKARGANELAMRAINRRLLMKAKMIMKTVEIDKGYVPGAIGKVVELEEKNFQQVHLSTFAGLDPARHLYEKWGFQLVEEKEGDTWGVRVREQEFVWTGRL